MDYIKIRFGNDVERFSSRFEKTFEEIFGSQGMSPMFSSAQRTWAPQMDVYETPDEIVIRAEIAGVAKEDLEVEVNSKAVRISGVRSEMSRVDDATYRLAEIQYGSFERVLFLPSPIDTEVVSSSYSNGFLHIRLAKLYSNRTHRIPIEDG